MSNNEDYKVKDMLRDEGKSSFQKYRDIMYGDSSLGYVIWAEFVLTVFSWVPGALGLFLRGQCYPTLFKSCGRGCVFGRNLTLRHAHKITLGSGVVLDDASVVDAKGEANEGIVIEDNVYIGRHTIVYCKNGNIRIGASVNISSNCQIFSSNSIAFGPGSVIGAFTYILSGGEYDYKSPVPFAQQSGMETKGPLTIGSNCWFGAHVVITDASSIGDHCVIGAGAVVTSPIAAHSVAVGIPARVIHRIG